MVIGRRQLVACFISAIAGLFAAGYSQSDETSIAPSGVDHLVYASADLERGMDEIEALLGVRPVIGGRHPKFGTHNAILSLGPGTYLEVIARDPRLPTPQRGALIDMPSTAESRLVTWSFRTPDVQQSADAVAEAGSTVGEVASGSRTKPDGSRVSWESTDPYSMQTDGAIPILINWGNTVHPSEGIPSGGELLEVVIEHPEPNRIRNALSAIGAKVEVGEGGEFRLSAKIATKDGVVSIQ